MLLNWVRESTDGLWSPSGIFLPIAPDVHSDTRSLSPRILPGVSYVYTPMPETLCSIRSLVAEQLSEWQPAWDELAQELNSLRNTSTSSKKGSAKGRSSGSK